MVSSRTDRPAERVPRHRGDRSNRLPARCLAAAAVVLLGTGAGLLPPSAAAAQAGCRQAPQPAEVISEVPWAQEWFGPERIWQRSLGDGVRVAVIDSGVDAGHPQLRDGPVRRGRDLLPDGGTDGRVDCHSHGTAVASIIAAAGHPGVGFRGLAPGAEILPVRVAEQSVAPTDPEEAPPVTPEALAEALRWAIDNGARVVNLSIVFYRDHTVIAEAVHEAVTAGVLVVAAVGQVRADDGGHPTPYPAAYPGVLGVGAIDRRGALGAGTATGAYVDLLAPGEEITAAVAAGGHLQWTGTSFAAPFVSAAAALVMAAEPDLTAAEVARRLTATADPGAAAPGEGGHGVVNPYRALAERTVDGAPVAASPPPVPVVDPVAQARADRWARAGATAALVAAGVLVAALLAVTVRRVARQGARRRWRPGRPALQPATAPGPTASGPDPLPEQRFYTVPKPHEFRTDR